MTLLHILRRQARRAGSVSRDVTDRVLASVGLVESQSKLTRDAQAYWRHADDDEWRSNSHWRDGSAFAGGELWSEVGRTHLDLFERMSRVPGRARSLERIVEWGCGGGANAVHFAPLGTSFVGVDISQESVDECGRQVAASTSTPYQPVLVDADNPEAAVSAFAGSCDLFLCFYVFELIPSPEYGARLLRIASRLLTEDGLALIQIKYDTGSWLTGPRRRSYRSGIANMTTYRIDVFWSLAQDCGLVPEVVHLVPRNALDERYAYFMLSRAR